MNYVYVFMNSYITPLFTDRINKNLIEYDTEHIGKIQAINGKKYLNKKVEVH